MRHKGRSLDTLTLLGELECVLKSKTFLVPLTLSAVKSTQILILVFVKRHIQKSSQTGLKILIYKIIEAVRRLQ